MITFLIYILLKKYRKQSRVETYLQISKFLSARFHIIFVSLMIILLALIPVLSRSQSQNLHYKIVQGGDEVGWMKLEKNMTGNKLRLVLVSDIKTRLIFQIKICAKETAEFENGRLIHSTLFRKTNGDVKLNKLTRLKANKYEVEENGEKQNLAFTNITTNLLSLYFQEPVGINALYSDKFESFVKVTKTDDGGYKVKFPDGNSNIYYYRAGICCKVIISHTFYTVEVILNS